MKLNVITARRGVRFCSVAAATMSICLMTSLVSSARADDDGENKKYVLQLPGIPGWYDGQPALYASTDTSDLEAAKANHLNYAPALSNAANTKAVDDIYTVTNFTQSNIVPSAPVPAGPGNKNTAYSPLWQLSEVTWTVGTRTVLKSEQDVLEAKAKGLVTVTKTNIVINCPIIFTPQGGLLAGARITDRDR